MVMEPQSLILVVSWKDTTYSASIIRLETPPPPVPDASSPPCDDDSYYPPPDYGAFYPPPPPPLPEVQLFQTGFSANIPFFPWVPKKYTCWNFSTPPSRSPEDLYMLPDWIYPMRNTPKNPLPGIIFNLRTKKCTLIKPPRAPKCAAGCAITMGDHIYYIAVSDSFYAPLPSPRFERYDTISHSWEDLEPLNPFTPASHILSYAVLDDTILFRMTSGDMLWAYNVNRNKWYTVKVLDSRCNRIAGEAVVINNIIYVLTNQCYSLVALTLITTQENDGDLVFTCDLLKEYEVPGMAEIKFKFQEANNWSMHLVHLGKDNFCVIRTCTIAPFDYHDLQSQYIQLTYLEVSEKKSIVTNICVHEFKLPRFESFSIISCFSMPDCKSSALKECTRLINPAYPAEVVTLPPELLQFLKKCSSQTNTFAKQDFEQGGSVHASSASVAISAAVSRIKAIPFSATKASTLGDVAAYERSNTDEEGDDSICVLHLPHDFTYIQLVKELNKFGPIKGVTIHRDFNHMRGCLAVDVEFKSSTSKQNAIKASTLTILGRRVVIEEKKGTGGDSNRTSCGSSCGCYSHGEEDHVSKRIKKEIS